MVNAWFSCKPCTSSDPTQDTVKVDPKLVLPSGAKDEQESEAELRGREAKEQQLAEERRRKEEEEARRRKEEEESAAAAAAAAAEEERLRREAEEAARREAEEKAWREAEGKAQQEAAAAAAARAAAEEEQERKRQEAQRAAEELAAREREAVELAAVQKKVAAWCKEHGFSDMNTQKKTMRGATKFALHTAVKHKNEEMVGLLLKCGANRNATDSHKHTPFQLAEALNKAHSHDRILNMLR